MFIPESTLLNWKMLNAQEKKQFFSLIFFIFFFNFLDTAAIASFIPFIDVLTSVDAIQKYRTLRWLHNFAGNPPHLLFCYFVGSLCLSLLVTKTFFAILLNWGKVRFSNAVYERKSTQLLKTYLSLPYQYYLTSNTAAMLKVVTKDINIIRSSIVISINLFVNVISLVLVVSLLFMIEPYLFFFCSIFGIVSIKLITTIMKSRIYAVGAAGEKNFREVFVKGKQSLDGVKDIILTDTTDYFVQTYNKSLHAYTISNIKGYLYRQNPGSYLELIAYSLLMFSVFYLINDKSGFQQAVPVLGALAMASRSIIPALNGVNSCLGELRLFLPVLHELEKVSVLPFRGELQVDSKTINFEKHISLEKIAYCYPNTGRPALKEVSIEIPKGHRIGLVGKSGSGKSTLMDVLLGLYEDYEGKVSVDSQVVNPENLKAFRQLISYVPQNIFLLDATVWENIAFAEKDYDKNRMEEALKAARIYDLVQGFKHKEYEVIGERGIKLSGGERQRLGIARALYRNTPIIIFDESTSALDNQTEREFQENINRIGRDKTLIIIAHRLTTIEKCDQIYLMESGRIVDTGDYASLSKTSSQFQKFLLESQPDQAFN